MKTLISGGLYALTLTVVLLTSTGCSYAKKAELDALRADLNRVERTSDQALNTANEARDTAGEANERSLRLEEMMNRSFKKSMYK